MANVVNGTQTIRKPWIWQPQEIIFLAAECVVSFLTVVTNGLVLAAVVHNPALRKPGNWFVVNLAVADLFVGVLTPPLVIISETSVIKNFYLCILNNSVIGAIVINSFTSLACLVYDRFSLVRNAFHTSTTESVMAKLGLSWVVSLGFGMVPLMGWHNDRSEYRQCRYREVIPLEYNVYLQMFGFFIPFLLAMLIVHTLVFREFRKSNRLMAYKSHETRRLVRYLTKREKRLFESLVLIFILFTVCWLPHYIVTCIHLFCPETMVNFYMEFFFVTLTHTNSVVNPVVYALGQSEFRHALHKLFPFLFTADKYYQGTSSHMRQIPSCVTSTRLPTTVTHFRTSSCNKLSFTDSLSTRSLKAKGKASEVTIIVHETQAGWRGKADKELTQLQLASEPSRFFGCNTELPGPEKNGPLSIASVKSGGTKSDDVRTIESTTNNDPHASPLSEMYMSTTIKCTPSDELTQEDKHVDQTEPNDTPASVTQDDTPTHQTELNDTLLSVPGPCDISHSV